MEIVLIKSVFQHVKILINGVTTGSFCLESAKQFQDDAYKMRPTSH